METYQFESKPGDVVILPNGELGIVTGWEMFYSKTLYVYPLFAGWLRRFFWRITNKYECADGEINNMVKICNAGEFFKRKNDLTSFIIPNLWKIQSLAERELDRLFGLADEEDFRELERTAPHP